MRTLRNMSLTIGVLPGILRDLSNLSLILTRESRELCAEVPNNPDRIRVFKAQRPLYPRVSLFLSPGLLPVTPSRVREGAVVQVCTRRMVGIPRVV